MMQKVFNYIFNGRGIGALLVLALSLIMAVFFAIYVRSLGIAMIPYAQSIADQLLPIKVENGIVVEPANMIKSANIQVGDIDNFSLPIVIDTRTDSLNTQGLKDGIYLTRTTLYTVNKNEIKMTGLSQSLDIPRGDYTAFFGSVVTWTYWVAALFFALFTFIFYFFLSFFYTWCSYAVSALAKKKLDFDQRMRLSVVCLIVAYALFLLLGYIGLTSAPLLFFIVVIILQAIVIHKAQLPIEAPAPTPEAENKE